MSKLMVDKNTPKSWHGKTLAFIGLVAVAGIAGLGKAGKGIKKNPQPIGGGIVQATNNHDGGYGIPDTGLPMLTNGDEKPERAQSTKRAGRLSPRSDSLTLPKLGALPSSNEGPVDTTSQKLENSENANHNELIARILKPKVKAKFQQEVQKNEATAAATQAYWNLVVAKHYLFRFGDTAPPEGIEQGEFLNRRTKQAMSIVQECKLVRQVDVDAQLIAIGDKLVTFDGATAKLLSEIGQSYSGLHKAEQKLADQQLREDARQKYEQAIELFENFTEEQIAGFPDDFKALFSKLNFLMDWQNQLLNDLEILQVTLEERYRETNFDLPKNPFYTAATMFDGRLAARPSLQAEQLREKHGKCL